MRITSHSTPSQLSLFVTVAQAGGFSSAGRQLGISAPAVSKGIAQLEKQLNIRLFHRSTRQFSLTDDGKKLYEQVSPLLAQLHESIEGLNTRTESIAGKIRINMPDSFGRAFVMPFIGEFLQTYPDVELDLVADDKVRDIIKEGFDIGIGNRINEDSRLIARKIYDLQLGVFASGGYANTHGLPQTPDELAQHNCITFCPQNIMMWTFNKSDDEQIQFHPRGNLTLSNIEAVYLALKQGVGLGYMGSWHVANDIRAGTIVPVLSTYWSSAQPIWLYYSSRKNQPKRIKVFIEFLRKKIEEKVLALTKS